jgi:hypothetical protein
VTDLQKLIDQLEEQGNDAELLCIVACDLEARARNRRLADEFRALANGLRHGMHAMAA